MLTSPTNELPLGIGPHEVELIDLVQDILDGRVLLCLRPSLLSLNCWGRGAQAGSHGDDVIVM